ncbi:MAG: ATPase [Calditrichaeota bacterium]|nr:MAG: ATPase [Calditrichota bacterium]
MLRGRFARMDRMIKEKRHDAYQEHTKWPEPTLCTRCGAVFVNGRWTWNTPPERAHKTVCPACRRKAHRLPAGYVEIKGTFFKQHRDEILGLIQNVEKREKSERPLESIIETKNGTDGALISTTGIHLARRIGEALARSYKGELSFQYPEEDKLIRVTWER